MANEDIVSVYQAKIPTVVSYNSQEKKLIIGEAAKADGVNNTTNMFNFKMDLFLGEKEFSSTKKYWYGVTYEKGNYEHDTFTAREVIRFFLKELLNDIELPPRLIVGEPAVRENSQKENFRKNIRDVFSDLGYKNIDLFFEPFAVFQYYRHYENLFPVVNKTEIILVIDVGGGTFNSCIIATTNDGKLSRGGANMLPLGLQGEQCGGTLIDSELAKLIIERCKKKGVVWKDNPKDRTRSPVLFRIEDAKIYLSDKIGSKSALASSYEKYSKSVFLPKGTLHPELDINAELNGNDLKTVIQHVWRTQYGKIITKTVTEAEGKLKKTIEKIDKVIIAGGSSKLPFMREEVLTVLPTLVKKSDIYIGSDLGNAVACGIACECKELVKSKKYPDLTVGTVAPCLLKDLYIGLKSERRGSLFIPLIDGVECNGLLFSSPFEITKVVKFYELDLDMDFTDRLFYYFDDKPLTDDDPTHLNVTDYVISLPAGGKISKKVTLEIDISENGSVRPTFHFKGKGAEAKKLAKPVICRDFYLEDTNIIEGDGFIGIDFGTSNSYVAKFLSPKKNESELNNYPSFDITHSVHELLRMKQIEIEKLQETSIITKQTIKKHAADNKYLMIFHSNKIENNVLTRGETEEIIGGVKPPKLSKSQAEAVNLDAAFLWVMDNLEELAINPENFIRNVNKLILDGISSTAGEYRTGPVKIAGMDYIPPAGFVVPSYMVQLSEEIKIGVGGRSPIEFTACIHTKLVMIHPFEDGNGRTARLIMNAILLQSNLPMIIINYSDKQRYFDAIVSANNGELSEFVQFIVDCLETEIEEIKASIFVDSQTQEVTESDADADGKNNFIYGNKLSAFLTLKLEEKAKEKEKEYTNWCLKYDDVKQSVIDLVDKFNFSPFKQLGYSMRYFEFDRLTYEKYVDLSKGRKVPRTWFFRIDFSHDKSYEKILFFFQHASIQVKKLTSASPVSLSLARYDGTSFRRLEFEPVQLHEIGISNDNPVFVLHEDKIEAGDIKTVISDCLFYDVVHNYL
jgi:molecular chaperone DnaK (HSP70)/Fic family protein